MLFPIPTTDPALVRLGSYHFAFGDSFEGGFGVVSAAAPGRATIDVLGVTVDVDLSAARTHFPAALGAYIAYAERANWESAKAAFDAGANLNGAGDNVDPGPPPPNPLGGPRAWDLNLDTYPLALDEIAERPFSIGLHSFKVQTFANLIQALENLALQ